MMSIVVDAAVSVILERLIDDLISIISKLPKHGAEIEKEIKKWHPMLYDLRSVLEDAENKKSSNSKIEPWLEDLEDIALDLEDVLEEFQYDIKQSQKQENERKRKRTPLSFVSWVSKIFQSQPKIVMELQNLTARLNDIMERKKQLDLLKRPTATPIQRIIRPPSGSTSVECILYGREVEKNKIIEFLRHGEEEIDVHVLPIVGTGGIGKTTLLQHVYNDDEVVHSFQVRAWVCISQDWNLRNILKTIIEAITKQPCDFHDLRSKAQDELRDKKFCIVLDDLWSDDIMQWRELRALLMVGAPGSKVLVTTRNVNVAHRVKTVHAHIKLNILSENDSLDLFWSTVEYDIRSSSNSKLKELGEKISQKCGGLPLAITILGSLLRGNHNDDDWNAMLNNTSLVAQNGQYQIDSVLKMSYNDLPYDLKSCFLFCTIFPEDHKFREKDLVKSWIFAGLIKSDIENIGHSYFMELVSRSLFTSFAGHYVMHDLIREMGRNHRYGTWENRLKSWNTARHLSIKSSMVSQFIRGLGQQEKKTFPLRTLMIVGEEYNSECIDGNFLFSKLPKLRVLQARALPIGNHLSIGHMKHLKYLNSLQIVGLERLPSAVGNLNNLQHLQLDGCMGLIELPPALGNLASLQHLQLNGCTALIGLPPELGSLASLQHLELNGCTVLTGLPPELGSLAGLQHLWLAGCTALTGLPPELGSLASLQDLWLDECTALTRLPPELGSLAGLQHLRLYECTALTGLPPELGSLASLQNLQLDRCTALTGLPPELGSVASLQDLRLYACTALTGLPPELGSLAGLQHLRLYGCTALTGLPPELGSLASLQDLRLYGCPALTGLPPELGSLASLQELSLGGCTALTGLPPELGSLASLQNLFLGRYTALTGLPPELGSLAGLKNLQLYGCTSLTGLPPELGSLASLQHLGLDRCTALTGLPPELGSLASLQHLGLDGCTALTGLPPELGSLASLQHLGLDGSTELGNLSGVRWGHTP